VQRNAIRRALENSTHVVDPLLQSDRSAAGDGAISRLRRSSSWLFCSTRQAASVSLVRAYFKPARLSVGYIAIRRRCDAAVPLSCNASCAYHSITARRRDTPKSATNAHVFKRVADANARLLAAESVPAQVIITCRIRS
jgi:hypothetical protein